jgi:hypothetical protein
VVEDENRGGEPLGYDNKISVPGHGQITYDDAEALEDQGLIRLTGIDENGNPVYVSTGKKADKNIMLSR